MPYACILAILQSRIRDHHYLWWYTSLLLHPITSGRRAKLHKIAHNSAVLKETLWLVFAQAPCELDIYGSIFRLCTVEWITVICLCIHSPLAYTVKYLYRIYIGKFSTRLSFSTKISEYMNVLNRIDKCN